jgi:hypothetical protein
VTSDTRIEYTLIADAGVELAVYDVHGRRMAALVDAQMTEGSHSAVWNTSAPDGTQPASGVYFVRLTAGGRAVTKKVILLR